MSFEVNLPTCGGIAAAYPTKDVTGIKVSGGNTKIMLNWSDPTDTVGDDGTTFVKWKGTKVVRKLGAYPVNERDGVQIIDNQVRNAYKTTAFVDTGLINDQTYYYGFFPYSEENVYNRNEVNRISAVPVAFRTYGCVIDTANSNPSTAVTYTESDCPSAGSDEWDDFFGFYPCLFKDGAEVGRLNPLNFAQFEDGSAADITSGDAGDVMIAFPRRGLKMYTSDNKIYIYITDDPNADGFTYYAHTRGAVDKEVFYLGAYKGYVLDSKLRSLSGKTPKVSVTLTNFRTYAHNNGSGYELSAYYQLVLRQAMFIMKYKSLDSQTAVGNGSVTTSVQKTGHADIKGMNYGDGSTNIGIKLFGIEDFWGNIGEWIDGLYYRSSGHILTATDNFNSRGICCTDQGASGLSGNLVGYVNGVSGNSEIGFFPSKLKGSSSTYFADYAHIYNDDCVPFVGGDYDSRFEAGAFCIDVSYNAYTYIESVGARLMYL